MSALPTVPVCHSWSVPPLPQRNSLHVLLRWQDDRCAVCAARMPAPKGPRLTMLHEDHDHATGDVRGYLCPSCNYREGTSALSVFDAYRSRPPAVILGVLQRYHVDRHPVVRAAEIAWENAVSAASRYDEAVQDNARRAEMTARHPEFPVRQHPLPELTPLMAAARRVGLTYDEWYGENHRWRFRRGMDHGVTEWREFMRDELRRWARERRAGLDEVRGPCGWYYEPNPHAAGSSAPAGDSPSLS